MKLLRIFKGYRDLENKIKKQDEKIKHLTFILNNVYDFIYHVPGSPVSKLDEIYDRIRIFKESHRI